MKKEELMQGIEALVRKVEPEDEMTILAIVLGGEGVSTLTHGRIGAEDITRITGAVHKLIGMLLGKLGESHPEEAMRAVLMMQEEAKDLMSRQKSRPTMDPKNFKVFTDHNGRPN